MNSASTLFDTRCVVLICITNFEFYFPASWAKLAFYLRASKFRYELVFIKRSGIILTKPVFWLKKHNICAVSSLHFTFYSLQYTVYSLRFTVYILQFTVYILQFTVYILQFTVYSMHFTVHSLQFTTTCLFCHYALYIRIQKTRLDIQQTQ